MQLRILACLLVLGWSSCLAAADWLHFSSVPPLAYAQQVRCLSVDEARSARPVHLSGVITHLNPHLNDFFIQDETAGIYVYPTPLAAGLKLGDRIELEGESNPGDFAPCICAKKITRLGTGKLPDPIPFNLSAEESRWLDGQWVQVWVVVRAIRKGNEFTYLDVYNSQGSGVLVIPGEHAAAARTLKDVAVTVRGVCVPYFENRMIAGPPRIFLAALPEPPPSNLDYDREPEAPPRMIDHLLRFSPAPHPGSRRVKIAGVVTASPFPGMVIIQDNTAGATVWTTPPRTDIPIGARIEAYGLLRVTGRQIALTQAKVTLHGISPLPPPMTINAGELASGVENSLFVRLEGRLEAIQTSPGWTTLLLGDGVNRFEAYLPGSPEQNNLSRLEPGSRLAVSGVAFEASPDGKAGAGPNLYLPNPESLTLLELPPQPVPLTEPSWWTATRVSYLCVGFLVVTLCGSSWLMLLRYRVRQAAAEVKRQYEETTKLERQLRRAAKLEAVGRLAGGIAHDFNNLLTVINGCAELLVDDAGAGGASVFQLAEDIRRAGERAAGLTGQLLTFSRKREIQVSAVNINEVVADTVRLLKRVIGENIHIETNLSAGLSPISGEPGLLHQVVMNLAVNAKDAMPDGGTLTLTTTPLREPIVAPTVHRVDATTAFRHYVRLTVTDTGMGMTDEVKARIFEPFFTTKEVGKGTGLGLATVYGIIKTIRGKIRVDSELGRGTTFHIDLRVHGEPASDSELPIPGNSLGPVRHTLGAAKLKGTTVLVVEDNAMVRDLLVMGLSAEGATVLAAENAHQALRLLAEYPNRVDIMVTDVVMPGMSGRMLADRVRLERPTVKVIFMSGYTGDEVLREGVLADQVEFLQKPFTPDHLTNRLLAVLERASTERFVS